MPKNEAAKLDDLHLDGVVDKPSPDEAEDLAQNPATRRRSARELGASSRRRVWRVNYLVLLATVVLIGIVGPSLHLWRNYQVQRNATILADRARVLEEERDFRGAADFYHRYLRLVPDDDEAIVARARVFNETALSPDRVNRAIALLLQAVDVQPDDVSLREMLAERLMQQQRWDLAREQAEQILDRDPRHLEADRIATQAYRAQAALSRSVDAGDVAARHREALDRHAGDPVISASLATLYRDNVNAFPQWTPEEVRQQADQVMDLMVAEHPEDGNSYLGRYRYRQAHGLPGSMEDLERGLELLPDSVEILLAGVGAFLPTDVERSQQLAERLVKIAPERPSSHQALAETLSRQNQGDEAILALQTGLEVIGPDDYQLRRALLGVALEHRRLELARETWKGLRTWLEAVSPYLGAVERRRLQEDLQVADVRWLLLSGQGESAIPILKRLTVTLAEGSDADENLRQRLQRWWLLAEAYRQTQQWDLAADAMAEAAKLNPTGYRSLLGEAEFARRGGDLDRAIQLAQDAAGKPDAPAEVWLELAEYLIEAEFRRSPDDRNWRRVGSALERARAELDGTPAYVALRVRWALADDRPEEARAELQSLLPVESVPLSMAREIAILFLVTGETETAHALVQRLLDSPQLASEGEIAYAELLTRQRDYSSARRRLEELAQQNLESERQGALALLAALELEGGYVQDLRRRLARWRDEGPASLPLLELGASLAMQGKAWEDLTKYLQTLRRLEGPDGSVWRFYQALADLEDRDGARGVNLVSARDRLKELEGLRPNWPANLVVKGRLAERQNNLDAALVHYQEAVRQGARGLLLVDWLASGLYRQNRFSEAAEYLRQMGPMAGTSSQLAGLAMPAYLREGRNVEAVRMARMGAELHPDDPLPQMLYGQVLAVSGESALAEEQFRRAVELAPDDTRVWGGLVWFLAQSGRPDELRATLEDVRSNASLSSTDRSLLAARGYAMIGDRGGAAIRFQEVLDSRPDDPAVVEEVARFYLQFNLPRALQMYRRLLELVPESQVARRSIALILGMAGTDEDLGEALELMGTRDPDGSSPLDDRLKAVLLMRGTESQQQEAVERMEQFVAMQSDPPPMDRILLARSLEVTGRGEDADQQYQLLLENATSPEIAGMYVAFLLRENRRDDAETWLDRLEELGAGAASRMQLRAQWLVAGDRAEELDELVSQFVEEQAQLGSNERVEGVQLALNLLKQHQRLEAAEQLLRLHAEKEPLVGELLVGFLAEQQRLGEALQAGIEFAARDVRKVPPRALLAVMTIIAARKASTELLQQDAEVQVERARAIHAKNVPFLFDLGTLRVMQGRDDEAIDVYESVLAIRPEHLPSLNNLAIMLAAIPERQEEALAMIRKLKSYAPDSSEVKDSYALVLLGVGQYAEARDVMRELVDSSPGNARYQFHLAVAEEKLGNSEQAGEALRAAMAGGIENELLTPAEDEYFARLLEKYGGLVEGQE